MLKTLQHFFSQKKDTTDSVVDKLRVKLDRKTDQMVKAQEEYIKTVTYYIAKAQGNIKESLK